MADATATIRIDVNTSGGEANVRRLSQELNGLTRTAANGGAANDNYRGSIDRLTNSFGGASRASGVFGAAAGRVGSALGAIGFGAATAGALSLTGAMTAATKAASEYQDVLAKISTNVDTATFNMKGLSEGILAQSRAFGGMPKQQAEAAYDIISAGADNAEQAITTLTAANKLSVGGMTTVGVAADGLTSVLNAYAARGLTAPLPATRCSSAHATVRRLSTSCPTAWVRSPRWRRPWAFRSTRSRAPSLS